MSSDDDPKFFPFQRHDAYGTLGVCVSPQQRIVLTVLAVTVAPIKMLGALICLLSFWACCRLSVCCPPAYQTRVVAALGRLHCRLCLMWLGFIYLRWVKVREAGGGTSKPPPTPVAIVSTHTSWLDILVHMSHSFPSFVARDKTANMPLVGVISKLMGCIYVDREHSDPTQPGVALLVKERMQQMTASKLPDARPILLFPEGTTTNGHYLLPFKTGAFLAGVPVEPVILRYGQGRFSCSWEMIPAPRHMFLLLCHPWHTLTCYQLPVYVPNEEERANPKLYAANVRKQMMAFAPWLHETDGTFEDKKRLKALLQREAEQGTYRKQA